MTENAVVKILLTEVPNESLRNSISISLIADGLNALLGWVWMPTTVPLKGKHFPSNLKVSGSPVSIQAFLIFSFVVILKSMSRCNTSLQGF